jgi:amino acid permease
MFTLFSGTVGAGLLSLPMVYSYYGAALGTVLIIVFGMLTYHMIMILNNLISVSGKKSYANICSYFFGKVNSL